MQITGTSATVGGKNVVRSVNGATANASGEVTLGPDVIQYKSGLSSIKSVAGTFAFDSNSGISADDLPEGSSTSDWTGVQFGMKNGNDKVQFIFNGPECYFRFSDKNLGGESWDGSSWKKYDLTDLAQDSAVVHKAGSETISGAKTLTGGMAVVDTMIVRDLSAVKGTNPSSNCFMGLWFADKNAVPGMATANGNVLGAVEVAVRSDGTSDIKMYSNRNEADTDDRAKVIVGWRFNSEGKLFPTTVLTNTVAMDGYETGQSYKVFRIEKDGNNADNFVISGANQTLFLCSGEIGYDDPDAAAIRAALRKSAEDVVIASDNRVVIASNCNSRDISQVKIAYLDASGYFHLPVDPVSSSNDDSIPTTRWVNTKITESRPKAYVTATYRSGSSWYRKWSDGFVEQGGHCGNSGTQSFVTAFTDYANVTLVGSPTSGGAADDCFCVLNPTSNTSFSVSAARFGGVDWYACGY